MYIQEIATHLTTEDVQSCTIIMNSHNETKVLHFGATQDVLATLRQGIRNDELIRAACADVVDRMLLEGCLPVLDVG
jgi:hypothetical protein